MRLFLAVLSVTLLAGCGGGDDRLSAEELETRANEICNEFDREIGDLGSARSLAEIEDYAGQAGPIFNESLNALRQLEPPEPLESKFERWIGYGQRAADTVDEIREAAAQEDV